jgi:PAS domain S-box-containing protein
MLNDQKSLSESLTGDAGKRSELEELKHENAILKQNLKQYRSYVDNLNATIVVINPEGIITYASPNWTNLLGHELDEVINKPVYETFIHPDDVPRNAKYMDDTLANKKKNPEIEYRIRHKDGSWKWHSTMGSPILDEDGNVIAFLAIARDITERKASEQRLRESEAQFRLLIETMHEGVILVDNEDRIQYINTRCCDIFGYTRHDLLGKTGYKWLIYKDDHPTILEKNKSRLKGISDDYVVRGVTADGKIIWLKINGAPILNDSGEVVGSVGIMSDITESKLTSEALQRSEEKYRLLYENIIVGVFQCTFEDRYLTVNKSFAHMCGYDSPEQIVNSVKSISKEIFVNPEDRELLKTLVQQEEYVDNFEVQLRKKNGDTFWSLISARLIRDEAGNPSYIEGTNLDVTNRKQAEIEKFKLLSIIENSMNEVYVFDAETMHYEYMNQKAIKNSGYSLEEMKKLTPEDFNLTYDANEAERMIRELMTGQKQIQVFEAKHKRKDGSIYDAEVQIQLHREAGHDKFFAIVNDVTESKSLKMQLLASQKMDAIGRLAGGIAHDFNNLLTIILGYAEEMIEDLGDNENLRFEAEEIVKAGKRASSLTRQLLTFSRKQVIQPQLMNINDAVGNLVKMLYRMIGEDIEIETKLADDLGNIKGDPGQIEQIIINLALNARDAMQTGGKLVLETSNLLVGQEYQRNHIDVKPGFYSVLTVTDNGCGMDEDTCAKIFEPFFTTKQDGQGLGLGLSTVYGIVKQAEGQVLVNSKPGEGTSITILLPTSDEKIERSRDSVLSKGLMGNNEHILIVEDEKPLLHFLSKLIRSLGYKVTSKSDSAEALELIEKGMRPNLVLSDVVMPGMNGKELSKRILGIVPGQKLLFMSGYTDDALLSRGILEEGIPFIQKPFTSKDIAQVLHDVLNKKEVKEKSQLQILMLDDEESIRVLLQRACVKKGHIFTGVGTLDEALPLLAQQAFDVLLLDMHLFGMDGIHALKKVRAEGHEIPVVILTGAINSSDTDVLNSLGVIKTMEKSFDNQPLLTFLEEYLASH